jgi:hypothetical protein
VHDPDGIQSLTLYYRLDPATNYTAVPMKDDGTGGDAITGDGIFSATIPGQAAGKSPPFTFPPRTAGRRHPLSGLAAADNEPGARMPGDVRRRQSGRQLRRVSFVDHPDQCNPLGQLSDLSNEGNDCTFVNGTG